MKRKLKVHVAGKKKWAQKSVARMKKKGTVGSLHKALGVPKGKKIPASKMRAALKKGGKIAKKAQWAVNMNKNRKSKR
jgi:hypothetical protein